MRHQTTMFMGVLEASYVRASGASQPKGKIMRKNSGALSKSEPNSPRSLLTVRDIARLDNCSEKTVRRAIEAGLLEATRIGPGGRLLRITPQAHATYRLACTSGY